VADEIRMDGDIRVDLNATVEGLAKELRILRDRLSERDAKIAVLQSQLMEANLNADKIAHELGVCYDHDRGCGGAGPVEEQIKAIKRLYQEHTELTDIRSLCASRPRVHLSLNGSPEQRWIERIDAVGRGEGK
jgi:hypothetical protein